MYVRKRQKVKIFTSLLKYSLQAVKMDYLAYLSTLTTCQPCRPRRPFDLVNMSSCRPCRPVILSTVSVMTVDLVRTGTLFDQLLAFYFCSG